MKKNSLYFSLFFLTTLILTTFNACKTTPKEIDPEFAKYILAFTYGNISSSSSIQIELTQDMPAVEINKEIDEQLFKFSPAIKGKAYWADNRKITFVPEPGQIKSGQKYDAWFDLSKVIQVDKKYNEFYFSFHTPEQNFNVDVLPYSPMKDNDLVWNSVQGNLYLADDASVENIKSMFSITGGTHTPTINITPSGNNKRYSFSIDSLKRGDFTNDYILKIAGKPIGASKEEKPIIITLPKLNAEKFQIIDARLTYDPQEHIRVTFSDPLLADQNIQGLITLNGADNFTYDIQKNVLKIYFESNPNTSSVSLTVYKSLKNLDRKLLDNDHSYNFSVRKQKPEIKLINTGNILPNSDNLVLPFQAVNLWAVDVKVIKIFENNVLGYLQSNDFGESSELRRFGRLILKKRIRLDQDPSIRLDQWNDFSIDMATMINKDPGAIYRVELSMKKEYSVYPCNGTMPQIPEEAALERFETLTEEDEAAWDIPRGYYYDNDTNWDEYDWRERDNPCHATYYMNKKESCVVFSSNLGVIAKLGSDKKLQVAVTDILTTSPISDATVDVYNFQMQKIGSGKTDSEGFATIEYKGSVPFALITTKDRDKNYLKITSNLALSLSNFDVGGKEIQKGVKGYIYGERGVWRPGDTLFITFIMEDKDKNLPKDHPVSFELFTPRGQLYKREINSKGVDGFYPFKVSTDVDVETGNWRGVIKVGGISFSKDLRIETVKPNRLKVRLEAGELLDASKESFNGSLSAQWLHGAIASNLKAKVEMTLSSAGNPFKGYEDYTFNNPASKFETDTYTLFEGQLNTQGEAKITARLPQATTAPGMLRATITSRVFETGGDASFYTQTLPYSPFASYVGLKSPATNQYSMLETDTDNVFDIVTLSPEGKPLNRKNIQVKVYKINWSWWWSNNNENLSSYINSTSASIILDENISTQNGKGKFTVRVDYPSWGRYLVMAKDTDSGHTTGKIVYIDWPSWRGRSAKQDPNGLTMLSFSTDKNTYDVGEKATVIIPKSSKGHTLISIENGSKVVSRHWVKTNAEEDTQFTFTVTEDLAPNFYIFANMLQPHEQEDNDLPIRMYGVLNIHVENKNTILKPVIQMPDELRPEAEFQVSVSEEKGKPMTYTLAIVDEGLLDLTSFRTPNAWQDFYAKQSLGVRTWDMFDMVVGADAGKVGPLLSIGGDESLKQSNNPLNRFKPVVKYLGPFTLKKGEKQQHKVQLPSYIGSVRVMVVAGSQEGAYGNAEKAVPVKNPLMILSTLPRVASINEEILLPVNVFAMDKKVKNVSIHVKANNLFELTEGTSKSLTFTDTGDQIVYFKLRTTAQTGAGKIEIVANGNGETSTETIDIEVRNPNPTVLLTSQAFVEKGETKELSISMDSPQPEDWIKIEISRMPAVDLSKNLEYLLDYPHGCSEQVTSRAFPALYVDNFTTFKESDIQRMKYNINEAIRIISSRQLSDGGIAYWPGDTYPTEWVTTYAGHFLLEANRLGYKVPETVLNKWKQFQKKAAQSWNKADLYNSYYSYSISDLQQAYRLYTLALAGETELGAMNRLKESEHLSVQARWRLAAAYAVSGRKEVANEIINKADYTVDNYTSNNSTYGDPDRDIAMIMETFLLLDKTENALGLAYKLSHRLSSDYISTQTASFGLIAMAKLAEKMGQGAISYEWELNDVKQTNGSSGKIFQEMDLKVQKETHISFTNKGDGALFVRLTAKTKQATTDLPAISNGMNLYVKYQDLDGKEINVSSLTQGTEFYANVIIQNVSGEWLSDIALTQVFPSGWEIFNERLFSTEGKKSFNYQDIRDDRVFTYFNIRNGYSLGVRIRLQAAYCGKFYLPPVTCEAMYKPEVNARSNGQWVEVIQ